MLFERTGFKLLTGDEGINAIGVNEQKFTYIPGSYYQVTNFEIKKALKYKKLHLIPFIKIHNKIIRIGVWFVKKFLPKSFYYKMRRRYLNG